MVGIPPSVPPGGGGTDDRRGLLGARRTGERMPRGKPWYQSPNFRQIRVIGDRPRFAPVFPMSLARQRDEGVPRGPGGPPHHLRSERGRPIFHEVSRAEGPSQQTTKGDGLSHG